MKTVLSKLLLASTCALVASTYSASSALVYDGNISESEWGTALATSSGGPSPGFGSGHELNAIYATGDENNISIAIAGNVQDGNRILLFIDSKSGGYNDGSFSRTSAPQGVDDWNGSSTFDSGFNADFCLVIGTNGAHDTFFFDLFTLAPSGSSSFLGTGGSAGLGANPANSDNTKGFEFKLSKSSLGYTNYNDIQLFAAYISDGGYLSNQFLTHAGSGDGNYTNGVVTFGAAAPNPITVSGVQVPEPSTLLAVFSGLGMLAIRRRR